MKIYEDYTMTYGKLKRYRFTYVVTYKTLIRTWVYEFDSDYVYDEYNHRFTKSLLRNLIWNAKRNPSTVERNPHHYF